MFTFSGFATLGAVYNDSDDVKFTRDLSQPSGPSGEWSTLPDSVVGGQLNIRPGGPWEAALQVVSRYDYTSNNDPRLTWAFLRYSPDPGFSARLGRIGYDAYMQGDSRSVGFSYLTVRPPIEYYGTMEQTHIDGVDVVFRRPVGSGVLMAKLFAGLSDEEVPAGDGANYDLEGSEVKGGYLEYQWWDWRFRAGASDIRLENPVEPLAPLLATLRGSGSPALAALADDLALEGKHITNWNVGFAYDGGRWQGQLLYNRRQTGSRLLADAYSIYGLLGYRFARVTPYIGHAFTDAKSTRVETGLPGSPLDPLFRTALFEQSNWHIGARYNLNQRMAVKVQVDFIDAKDPQASYFNEFDPDWNGEATVFSLTLDMVF